MGDTSHQHGLSGDIISAHIEDFVEELGRISALQNIDIDHNVLNSLRLIEHRVRVQDVATGSMRVISAR